MFEWSLATVWYQVLHREYYKAEFQKAECGGGIMFYVENEGFYGAGIRGRPPGSSNTG